MAITIDLSHKLPSGVQSFEQLRESKCLYVDKTDYVYYLANYGAKSYILSRPQQFGKSLFANTLKAYFEGKKDLFNGLKICDYEKDWLHYPIAYFDFGDGDYSNPDTLINKISNVLKEFEHNNGIKFDDSYIKDDGENTDALLLSTRFKYDMQVIKQKTGLNTVVLIDDYDNPLITSGNLTKTINIYRGFFSVLKSADEFIRFVFITGVTKFAKTSIFSGQNQPEDITEDAKYSALCGITHEELIANFTPEIERQKLSFDECIAKLNHWYDGYLFHENGEKVFNPISLFNAFSNCDFKNYWHNTGIPTLLMKHIQKYNYNFKPLVNDVLYPKDGLKIYIDNPKTDLIPLFYYTGYLTIKSYDRQTLSYTLGFSNNEIKQCFIDSFVNV